MRCTPAKLQTQRGVTLIELVTVMSVTSIIILGLAFSAVSILGFYQDDWVLQDIRQYALASIDYIADQIEDARSISWDQGNGVLTLIYDHTSNATSIQYTSTDGFFRGVLPMLDFMDFPREGQYRMTGQRIVELEDFSCKPKYLAEPDDSQQRTSKVDKAVFYIDMTFVLITNYPQFGEYREYVRFRRKVFAPRLL